MNETLMRWSMRTSRDLVVLRRRIEQAGQILDASAVTRTRWATAASDLGRAVLEAGGGEAVIGWGTDAASGLVLDLVTPGLVEPALVEAVRRLVGQCEINSDLAGTEIRLWFSSADPAADPQRVARLRAEMAQAAVGDDITALHSENRRMETAMAALRVAKEGRERLLAVHRTVLDVLPDVVWRSDDSGRLLFVNPRWSVMTGRSAQRPGVLFDVVVEADRAPARAQWQAAVDADEPMRFECRLSGPGRRERWVLIHGRPHHQPGARRNWIGAITDVHDAKLREIEQARLIEFRDRMVGVVGHDLRSPLWFIGTASRMLIEQGDDPERRARYLRQIVDNVDRSRRMIDALLDYTRTQLGAELITERSQVDAVEVMRSLAEQARVTHADRMITFSGPPRCVVEADGDRLVQAMGNLLANALSYGHEGEPVELVVRDHDERVGLVVRNRADPIPREQLDSIFEPFRRARDDDRNGRGLGLGLYIVRAIARAHGGDARLRTERDGWIEACVELPRCPVESLPVAGL